MALIGSGVDPRLFLHDFSGYVDASKTSADSISNAVNSAANDYSEYDKSQKDAKAKLKASQAQIEAAITLFPDQAPHLKTVAAQIKDEETPLSDRVAVASGIADMINMGVGQHRYENEQGWKQKDYELSQREQAVRETSASNQGRMQGLQIQEAQNNFEQTQQDKVNKSALGPGLWESVLGSLGKTNSKLADNIREASNGFGDEQKYEIAQESSKYLPQVPNGKAPPTMDVAVAGGKQTMERGADGVWREITVGPTDAQVMAGDFLPPPDGVEGQTGIDNTQGVLPPLGAIQTADPNQPSRPGFTPNPKQDPRVQIAIDTNEREKVRANQEQAAAQGKRNGAVASANSFISDLDKLEKHPGFSGVFGVGAGMRWIPATDSADADTLFTKVKGDAFLQAVPALVGMGALSDAEGKKLETAFLGLSTNMSETAAREQIGELKTIAKAGISRVQAMGKSSAQGPIESDADKSFRESGDKLMNLKSLQR